MWGRNAPPKSLGGKSLWMRRMGPLECQMPREGSGTLMDLGPEENGDLPHEPATQASQASQQIVVWGRRWPQ